MGSASDRMELIASLREQLEQQPENDEIKADLIVQMLLYAPQPEASVISEARSLRDQITKDWRSQQRAEMGVLIAEDEVEKAWNISKTILEREGNQTRDLAPSAAERRAQSHAELARTHMVMACARACAARWLEANPPKKTVQLWGDTDGGLRTAAMTNVIEAGRNLKAASRFSTSDTRMREAMLECEDQRRTDATKISSTLSLFDLAGCDAFHGRALRFEGKERTCTRRTKREKRRFAKAQAKMQRAGGGTQGRAAPEEEEDQQMTAEEKLAASERKVAASLDAARAAIQQEREQREAEEAEEAAAAA
jgi:hypothetical protein